VDSDFIGTDRFVIERQIGAGSMGSVYLAYDRKLESRVALKTLLSVNASGIYRFKKEFRALADVSHRNLVTLHELFSQGNQWYFTMEYVEGKDLLAYLHGSRRRTYDSTPRPASGEYQATLDSTELPIKGMEMLFRSPLESATRLRAVLEEIVEGLMAVHAAGKLHRDLKPENVLVTESGRPVLLDFGIATEQDASIHETLATIIGTPAYMSPEQCRGKADSAATDWYALGVILYEALTGDVPFDGAPMDVIQQKQKHDPPAPSEVVYDVPEDLDQLCVQLLKRDPTERPDGAAILRALRSRRPASVPAGGPDRAASIRPPTRQLKTNFVGRRAQLRDLRAALKATDQGRPVVALVHGGAGIGKSTLIEEFISELASKSSDVVLKGRCYERESVPFKAFDNVIDTLSRYLRRLPASDAAQMLPREVEALTGLFPVLKRVDIFKRTRRGRALPPNPQELRTIAFQALKEMFSRIADLKPLVICVDDLQWSDEDSARLLIELISGSDAPAMLLCGVYRTDETEQSSGLKMLLEHLGQTKGLDLRDLPVSPLTTEESYALAKALLAGKADTSGDAGARKLGFESNGNPQLLTQLVQHVQTRVATGLASSQTARGLVSFERVLAQTVTGLSADARTLLELLSVSARPVREDMLTLVSSFNIDLPTALSELRAAKLVRGVSSHNIRAVEVYHDTIRETITSAMSPATLAGWHRRLAAALEASGANDLEALTSHLLGAGHRDRASLYAARAAEQASKALAFEKASRLYGLAAEHCQQLPRKHELQRLWADALVDAGRGKQAAEAYFLTAATWPEQAVTLRALGGVQLLLAGHVDEGLRELEEPLRALNVTLPTDFAEGAYQAGEHWRRLRQRGLGFKEQSESELDGEKLERLDLLTELAQGLLTNELDRPLPLLVELTEQALELGEPLRILRLLALYHVHVDVAYSTLAGVGTSGAMDVAEALARRLNTPEGHAAIAFAKGLSVYLHGRVEEATDELLRAEELYRNHCRGGAFEMRIARTVLSHLRISFARDVDGGRMRNWIREAEERGDRVSTLRHRLTLARGLLKGDRVEEAHALMERAHRESGEQAGFSLAADLMTRASFALYSGDALRCRELLKQLEGYASVALNVVPVWLGLTTLAQARLALLARASRDAPPGLLELAEAATERVAALELPCFHDDVALMRATAAAVRQQNDRAIELLEQVICAHRREPTEPLTSIFARRARGQLQADAEGVLAEREADAELGKREIKEPRRFARLFAPTLEEAARRTRSSSA